MQDKNSDQITSGYIKGIAVDVFGYLKRKWLIIFVCGIIGGALALSYAIFKKNVYKAECTFVLQDGGSGGLGQYAGLASLAGINIESGDDGLFKGDNIFELYRSRTMIMKTLLTEVNFQGKKEMLIDRYIDNNKLRKQWEKQKLGNIQFKGSPDKFSRLQDSLVTDIVKKLNKSDLSVVKPDKKLSIIHVTLKSTDELFAQAFTNQIVKNVNDFYSQTKTKKSKFNVALLQKQADSVKAVINSSISSAASSLDASPNANPQLLVLKVPSQRKQVDLQTSAAVYGEIVKNLEISKLALQKETPLIEVIDPPILPLESNKLGKKIALVGGFAIAAILAAFVLVVKRVIGSAA
ncbi:lipopolysaccharide biosynthesis protein [Mucilaginibacter achroorhodeus]|uniref:Lipopolysaccharide biosynthesis protein n=1 Tax=Mucilaginibacter achroorhodeus TaxID=2599294 RepID=A0A563U1R0_9SPHI|nr:MULTISPECIES: lipopolysaccharide biosynthesis protein [Mucilaginibacter]QXV67474.1 lipopolysaccharide biosynthesis protein [Mucilaginibacter sp. 21P]TWR25350.1 lipopolysaccharide biosynthesis protein [Mucilaginibacter achroorhodeus]